MSNALTGDRTIVVEGQPYTLRYPWAALQAVQEKHGEAPNLLDLAVLASMVTIGLHHHHPEVTVEQVMQWSPPLMPTVRAVEEAIQWAYFGDQPPTGEVKKKDDLTEDGSPPPTAPPSAKE